MTAQKGALVLIKVGNGGSPETYSTLGGLRTSAVSLNNQLLNSSNISSGNWRQLLTGGGIQSLSIRGSGIFTDAASEETMRGYAFANTGNNYQFIFANGDYLVGAFQVALYERSGTYDGVETYLLQLESSGPITFTSV